jgi:hypothetical protein
MAHEARASVQYGDFMGTIGIDGFNGLSVWDLQARGVPQGYFPLGFELYDEPREAGKFDPTFYALAVDTSILDGPPPDSVKKYARANGGQIPVFAFPVEVNLEHFLSKIKRLSIVIQSRIADRATLIVRDRNS